MDLCCISGIPFTSCPLQHTHLFWWLLFLYVHNNGNCSHFPDLTGPASCCHKSYDKIVSRSSYVPLALSSPCSPHTGLFQGQITSVVAFWIWWNNYLAFAWKEILWYGLVWCSCSSHCFFFGLHTGRYAYNVYSHFLSSLNGCYIFKMMILAACRCLNDILSIGAYLFTAYFYIPLSFHGLCMKDLDVIYV
jgi:hypothetical protein